MNCTQCGGPLERDAKFCGRCGTAVGGKGKPLDAKQTAQGWGCLALIGAVVAVLIFQDDSPAPDKPKVAAVDPAPCDKLIEQAEAAGLVRDRPAANRVDVEDQLWAEMPAQSKRGLALAVRCSFTRGQPRDDLDSYAVVYGYRSGKRLAQAYSSGSVGLD